jgi:hypothetical protein
MYFASFVLFRSISRDLNFILLVFPKQVARYRVINNNYNNLVSKVKHRCVPKQLINVIVMESKIINAVGNMVLIIQASM